MKKILFLLFIVFIFSCAYENNDFSWDINYDFGDADLSSQEKIWAWVVLNIEYVYPDNIYDNPLISPQIVLERGYGNCKNIVPLMMAIDYKINGNKTYCTVMGTNFDKKTHLVWDTGSKTYFNNSKFTKKLFSIHFDDVKYHY